jgi:4-aminobutyrate aminotransferase-like enzyme
MPDSYRGRLRTGDRKIGEGYADSVATLVLDIVGLGRKPMAFIAESIQGCGGQLPFPTGYLAEAYRHVRREGGLCIADEVQVGFGRVGTHWWAFETQGVVPDIVTMGKPIGAGHPLAAVATRPEIAAKFANGMEYFSTFGGNPVSAAIGLAVLDIIRDERLLHNARARGAQIMDGLRELATRHRTIGDVRGLGLFIGAEFVKSRNTLQPDAASLKAVIEAMKDAGVLLSAEGPHNNVLKIKPPLVIRENDCALFLSLLDRIMSDLRL